MSWCISVKTVGAGDTSTSGIRAAAATARAAAAASAVPSASASSDVDVDVARSASTSSESANAKCSPSTPLELDSTTAVGGGNINTGITSIGGKREEQPPKQASSTNGNNSPSTFTITVEPDAPISRLHSSIEEVTGLAASQQRLIYRGRIIQSAPVPTQAHQAQTPPASSAAAAGRSEDSGIGGDGDAGGEESVGHRNRSLPQSHGTSTSTTCSSTGTGASSDSRDEQLQRKRRQRQPSGRIRDVSGLCDGQTIHLVPRPRPASSSAVGAGAGSGSSNSTSTSGSSDGNGSGSDSSATTATASLLATLLGLGASSPSAVSPVVVRDRDSYRDGDDPAGTSNANAATEGTTEDASTLLGLSSLLRRTTDLQGRRDQGSIRRAAGRSRLVDRRRRQGGSGPPPRGPGPGRPPVRVPGSLEPVRQGLMTLHTMLHQHQHQGQGQGQGTDNGTAARAATTTTTPSPTDARRRFYLGQWVDVRDTVNQWLEATIIDVALPREVLLQSESSESVTSAGGDGSPGRSHAVGASTGRRRRSPGEEPIIAADDLLGRRALLLEPPSSAATAAAAATDEDDDDRGVDDASPEGERARERPGNEHVQLLLVHYNGWPHRWDEWIRSDSERIRPFRTRTVHSRPVYACPTVQSVYPDAPSTAIAAREGGGDCGGEDERGDELERERERERGEGAADRSAVLPEISRAIADVGRLLSELVEDDDSVIGDDEGNTTEHSSSSALLEVEEKLEDGEGDVGGDGFRATQSTNRGSSGNSHLPWLPSNSRGTGRTITSENGRSREESGGYNREELNALAPLLDRLGRTLVDAAPHVVALAASLPCEEGQTRGEEAAAATVSSSNSGGYSPNVTVATLRETPLLRASASASSSTTSDEDRDAPNPDDDDEYADFVNGMVNARSSHSGRPPSAGAGTNDATGRSVVGGGSGGLRRNGQNSADNVSGANDGGRTGSLLATYLAAASLAGLGLAGAGEGNSGSDTNSDNDNEGGGRGRSDEGTGNEDTSGVSALARLLGGGGGGGNGGNIDIHIHAVVTPGFEPGGLAFAALPPVATAQAVSPPTGSGSSSGNPSSATSGSPATAPSIYMNAVSEEEEDLGLFDELYSEVQVPSASSSFNSLTQWSNDGDNDDNISSPLAVATTASEEGANQEEEDIASLVSPDEDVFAPAVGLEPIPRDEEQSPNDDSSVESFHSVHSGNEKNTSVDQCTSARGVSHSHRGGSDGGAVAENSFSEPLAERMVKRRGSNDDANICPVGQEEELDNDNLAHEQVAVSSSRRSYLNERRGSSRRESAGQTPSPQIGSRPVTESPSPARSGGRRASRLMRVLRRSVGRR